MRGGRYEKSRGLKIFESTKMKARDPRFREKIAIFFPKKIDKIYLRI